MFCASYFSTSADEWNLPESRCFLGKGKGIVGQEDVGLRALHLG